jgi:crotonobetainyl-CoA:carnitine CoA-transferase CaiB-like acyl-CoA transferase
LIHTDKHRRNFFQIIG